jgi:hypothetical protein
MFYRIRACLHKMWLCGDEGNEIVEFAVSVPLLVVLAVAIFDFGSAFTLKHKLDSAVREGARVAVSHPYPSDPDVDEGCGAPKTICLVREVVANNLQDTVGNTCNLGTATVTHSNYRWTFAAGGGPCSGLSLEVNRGLLNPNTASLPSPFDSTSYKIENTKVTLVYPYQWQFNRAFKLINPSANYLSSTITVSTTMQNMD